MEPVYMNMPSYAHQDPTHYRPHCYSGIESRPPMSYGCWPWAGHYGYAAPGACHGCSNHAYIPPPYAWGSPYSHGPSYHCPGNYPYFPVQNMPPPPYNVMEHPRYEYEKNVPMEHHCCGCPNHHPLYPKEQRNVKIEEEEPEKEMKKNDSVVPLQIKNSPYPIAWLPSDHGKGQNAEGRREVSGDAKVPENGKTGEQQLPFLKGWLPVDLNNVLPKKRGDEEDHRDGGQQNLQFPLFWIPYNYKPDDMERESHKVKDVILKPNLELEKGSDGEQNFHVNNGKVGDQTASRAKDIPVKEAEQNVGTKSSIVQVKGKDRGEIKKIDDVDKVSKTDGSKRKSPSPPKSSKLPPVCLRVDPLPRKKSAYGKSRSPSPPGDKQKLEVKSNKSSKDHSLDNGEQVKDPKTIPGVNGNVSQEKSTNVNVETLRKPPDESDNDVSMKQAEVKPEEEHVAQNHGEDDAVIKGQSEDIVSAMGKNEEPVKADGMKEAAVKKCRDLSEEEAAVIIQSAFRRFDICRWKPIEKLKQIVRVREHIADVKRLIHELELSSDVQGRAKQKNVISETIMSLLLKLDTIQGLHPSIREVRKSVVRELVSFQEQLDSLVIEKPENLPTEEAMMRCDNEETSNKNEGVMKFDEGNEINSVDLQNQINVGSNSEVENTPIQEAMTRCDGEDASSKTGVKSDYGNVINLVNNLENPPTQEAMMRCYSEYVSNNNEGVVTSENDGSEINSVDLQNQIDEGSKNEEANLIEEAAAIIKIGMEEASENSLDEGVKAEQGLTSKEEDEKSGEVLQTIEATSVGEENEAIVSGRVSEVSSLQDESSVRKTDSAPEVNEIVQRELAELPRGVLDDLCSADGTNNAAVVEDSNKFDQSKQTKEEQIESPVVEESHHETTDKENHQTTEAHEASDLPLNGAAPVTGENEKGDSLDNCKSELNECTPQPLVNVTANSVEPSEQGKPCESSDSMVGEEGDLEKTTIINEHENARDALNMDEVERADEAKSTPEMELVSKQGQECKREHPPPKESSPEEELKYAVEISDGGEDMKEINRRLMEENQRLKEMMEKLIKSGQEQLSAISSLSGRVKDMEKRLSKKKKLKVKQFKSSKFDAFGGEEITA